VCVIVWKTKDPNIAKERFRAGVQVVNARKDGGRARRLCIDATNERYFASEVRDELGGLVPVELVIGSETIELPGKEEKITMKQMLGAMYVAELNDNHLALPPERYLKEDHRLPRMEKGQFVCDPDVMGRHGDTFDSGKNSIWALKSNNGAIRETEGIVIGGFNDGGFQPNGSGLFIPDYLHS